MFKGKKSKMFLLIFILSIIVVAVAIIIFVRTFCFYTISFETNCDIPMESYRVLQGFRGYDPGHEGLKKAEYYFDGWYADKECTEPFDFNQKIYNNKTAYAKWSDARALLYTYADGQATDDITQEEFDAMVEWVAPGTMYMSETFTNELGYTLVWFENPDMTGEYYVEPYDFDLYYDNITLYGAWCDMQEDNFRYNKVDYCNRCGKLDEGQFSAARRCNTCNSTVTKACFITKYLGYAKNIMIPDEIDGLKVRGTETTGDKSVFIDQANTIEKIVINENMAYIGDYTFIDCKKVDYVKMRNKVKEIGRYAFYNCTNLRNVKLSNNIVKISDYAFAQSKNLQAIVIPDACETIGKCAFTQTNIKTVRIPNNVKTIGDRAFAACNSLASLTLGDSVENIGEDAFANTVIESVYIPQSVKVIGYSDRTDPNERKTATVFGYNASLKTFEVHPSNTEFATVDNILFNKTKTSILFYPRSLQATKYTIGEQISRVEPKAFLGAKYLEEIVIGSNVTEICEEAFKDCHAMKRLRVIPNAAKTLTLYDGAFNNCTVLTHVRLERTGEIHKSAFQGCKKLIEIVLPNNTALHDGVFVGCESLLMVVFNGFIRLTDSPEYELIFRNANPNVLVYVPYSEIEFYSGIFAGMDGFVNFVELLEMCSFEDLEELALIYYDF